MVEIAILDDYANAALKLADWSKVAAKASITVFDHHLSDVEMITQLNRFDIICTLRERANISRAVLGSLPALRAIVVTDGHVRSIDYEAAKEFGVEIVEGKPEADLPSASSSTAEFTWALILATVRNIAKEADHLRRGQWQNTLGEVLADKTLGVVGLGRVGARVSHYAKAFDMKVLAWSQNLTKERAAIAGAKCVSKEILFRTSDIITIHYALSDRSRAIVGAEELHLMKPSAYLINTSRGPIVDTNALLQVLSSGRIAGAGLDVFDVEPLPPTHPLLALKNVTLTPHLGFVTAPNMRRFYCGMVLALEDYISRN